MPKFNIEEGLVQVVEVSYKSLVSEVLIDDQRGTFFHPRADVSRGYPLSPDLFNIFLENIIHETLFNNHTFISIIGKPFWNQHLAGGIIKELQDLLIRRKDS